MAREDFQHPGGGESLTRESDALGSDINSVMSKYVREQTIPSAGGRAEYGDFQDMESYHLCLNRVVQAEAAFEELPIAVKKACSQDVGKFLELVHQVEGRKDLEELGLVQRQVPESADPPAPPETPPAE